MTGIHEYRLLNTEYGMNSKLSERKTEKYEIQMLNCVGGLKAGENWMSAETSWVHGVARGQKDMVGDQCAKL